MTSKTILGDIVKIVCTWIHGQAEVKWNDVRKENSSFKLEFERNTRLVDDGHVGVVGVDAVHRRQVLHPAGAEDAEMNQGPTLGPGFVPNEPGILIVVMVNQCVKVDNLTEIIIDLQFISGL